MSGLSGIQQMALDATRKASQLRNQTLAQLQNPAALAAPSPQQSNQGQYPGYPPYYPPPPYGGYYPPPPQYYPPYGNQPYYPPPQGYPGQGYPPQGYYPQPQQGGYPPQGYYPPPQQGGYPPQGYYPPPQQGGYPQQHYGYQTMPYPIGAPQMGTPYPVPVMVVELAGYFNPLMRGGGPSPIFNSGAPLDMFSMLALQGLSGQQVNQNFLQQAMDEAYIAGVQDGAVATLNQLQPELIYIMGNFLQASMVLDGLFGQFMGVLGGPDNGYFPYPGQTQFF